MTSRVPEPSYAEREPGTRPGQPGRRRRGDFDLQAHRGGAGLWPENTLVSFAGALSLGVTTLECDVHVSLDGVPVVVHDRRLGPEKYADTSPAAEPDPFFPYVGGLVTDLSLAQLETIDAGSRILPAFPHRPPVASARIPTLDDLFALVADRGADQVRFNIETKFDAVAPHETAPRERFADVVVDHVRRAGLVDRVAVQSFDWGCLRLVQQAEPAIRLNVLAAPKYLRAGDRDPSPWLGGVHLADLAGLAPAVAAQGFHGISPAHGYPFGSGVADPAYRPFTTPALVDAAHELGLEVVPYTVDDPATMAALVDLGVDGLITNYPDRLRDVLAERREPLPPAYAG
jgi:glycerophosphoryl diester phosphodiesterase